MAKYLLNRIMQTIALLLIVSLLSFFLVSLMPNDPVYAQFGTDITQEEYQAVPDAVLIKVSGASVLAADHVGVPVGNAQTCHTDMNEMQKFWTGENTAGGLMVGAMYFADPILDRLDKFYGPYGYMAGCTDWTDEEYALYDNIRSAKSIEEQDELIYKFCVQFVQKDFHSPAVWSSPIAVPSVPTQAIRAPSTISSRLY